MRKAKREGPAPNPRHKLPAFYECGCCGFWHPIHWDGDCREEDARFETGQLDILFPDNNHDGWPDWEEVEQEED